MPLLEAIQSFDENILRAAHGSPGWSVPIFYALTVIGAGWGFLVIVPFLALRSTRAATIALLLAAAVTSTAVTGVKWLIGRTRPCDALDWCAPISVPSPGGWSFPSGHAAGSFAVAAFVFGRSRPVGGFLLVYALLVAWSRCVLGVHYPSDVFAGSLLGASLGAFGAILFERTRWARSGALPSAPAAGGERAGA